jgi:hypothetical protein
MPNVGFNFDLKIRFQTDMIDILINYFDRMPLPPVPGEDLRFTVTPEMGVAYNTIDS